MFSNGCRKSGVTPIKALPGIKPEVSTSRKLGCDAYLNIPRLLQDHKFTNQARQGLIFSYCGEAYRSLVPETGRIMISRDVRTVKKLIQYEVCTESVELEETL